MFIRVSVYSIFARASVSRILSLRVHILCVAHVVVIVFKYSMPSMGRWVQRAVDDDVGADADAHALRIITTKSNK